MNARPELRGRAARLARLFPTGSGQAARTPFVLLVVVLLGGGLIGLLVLNSALSEGSFRLADLQRDTKDLTDEQQALQRDIDAYAAPDALQRRARELGMVPGGDPAFLGPDGKVRGVPSPAAPAPAAARDPLVLAPEAMGRGTPPAPGATASGATDPAAPPGTPASPAPPLTSATSGPAASAAPAPTSPTDPAARSAPLTPTPAPSTPTPGR
ncbi:septum formation initiator family protein [Streptomyces sp. NPDC091377]|uniref:septum formation initiator family protein n=1 Tax=Streptomyces sp. NPDC091377 TaxID=3365995 RepID=UPI003805C25B